MRQASFLASVLILVSIAVTACGSPSALPLAKEGTLLRKIQDRGKVIVGVKYDVPTFGYLNSKTNTLEGFDPAVAREIAAYIFGDPNKVEFKEAVTKDRIPFLKDGAVDVILSTMTITEERMKEIDFSVVYYIADTRLLARKDNPILHSFGIASTKVAANKGSGTVPLLGSIPQVEVVQVTNASEGMQLLLTRQVDAMAGDDIALFGLALQNPELQVVGTALASEPLGAGVAKGNPELLDVVNTVIKNLKSSGKWKAIWKTEVGDKLGILTIPEPPADEWQK